MQSRFEHKPGHGVVSISAGSHRSRVLAKRDALIEEYLKLVPPIARRIHQTLPPSFDLEDLIQSGNLGLLRAAVRYRPGEFNDTPFSAYARPLIRGAILSSIRRRHYDEATRASIDEAPERASPAPEMEAAIDRRRMKERIDELRHLLSDVQCAVLDVYYSERMPSLAVVARTVGIPEWRATLAHAEALGILREQLKAA